jgi:hypothetical protein
MSLDIEAIRKRVAAATEGPWQWWNLEGADQGWSDNGPNLETVARGPIYDDGSQGAAKTVLGAWGHDAWGTTIEPADAEFIAHARTDVRDLLAEVERLRADNTGMHAVLRDAFAEIGPLRTERDALRAQRDAVLAIHADQGESQGYLPDGGYGYIAHCCGTCGSFGEYGEPWPCATARALGVTE